MRSDSSISPGYEIAVIGLAGKFPGAPNVETLWQHLISRQECFTTFESSELVDDPHLRKLTKNPRYVPRKPILESVSEFDADHFGISAQQAELMDPQHRLMIECMSDVLEDSGYPQPRDRVGVFVGAGKPSYMVMNLMPGSQLGESPEMLETLIANEKDYLATRLSYLFDLKGPSLSVQTACSSSLVAVHLACQSLLTYECDMALAGGVSIYLPQRLGYLYQPGGIFSPDGHCRAYSARANVMPRTSLCGVRGLPSSILAS